MERASCCDEVIRHGRKRSGSLGRVDAHHRLVAWQCCREVALAVYEASATFPAAEKFGLTAQLRRAAVSSAANIAEGYARLGRAELRHALSIALGSLAEVDTLLMLAQDLGYLDEARYRTLLAVRERASRTTFGLQRKLSR
jgi:four helix bundle protein